MLREEKNIYIGSTNRILSKKAPSSNALGQKRKDFFFSSLFESSVCLNLILMANSLKVECKVERSVPRGDEGKGTGAATRYNFKRAYMRAAKSCEKVDMTW